MSGTMDDPVPVFSQELIDLVAERINDMGPVDAHAAANALFLCLASIVAALPEADRQSGVIRVQETVGSRVADAVAVPVVNIEFLRKSDLN